MGKWKRRLRSTFAVAMSLLLVLTPLSPLMLVKPVAPVASALAGPKEDLKACLEVMSAVGGTIDAAVDAAAEIAKAVADPEFIACSSEAASLNVVTIAFMTAVTAFWALNQDSFDDPASCKVAAGKALLEGVATALDAAIDTIGGPVEGILKGLLGEDALKYIDMIAQMSGAQGAIDAEKQKLIDDIVGKLAEAMGPAMHYLNCGCAAAGTAAILKNAGEKVAAAANKAADSLDACWEILKDPEALVGAFLDDPIGTAAVVGEAICKGVAEVVDVCGAVGAAYEAAEEVVAAACELAGGACETVAAVVDEISCWFTDCPDPPPPPGPPPPCNPEHAYQSTGSLEKSCVCSGPKGVTHSKKLYYGSFGAYEDDAYVCETCPANEGVNPLGLCEACPVGFKQDPVTGKCSQPYFCGPGERYKPNNAGCFSCGEGFTFNEAGTGCVTDCSSKPWLVLTGVNAYDPGYCACPQTADNHNQIEQNNSCVPATQCNDPMMLDTWTNTCVPRCAEGEVYRKVGTGDASPWECTPCAADKVVEGNSCVSCADGREAIDNVCMVTCGDGQIRTDANTCTACPEGTSKEGNACVPMCRDGSKYVAPSSKKTTVAAGRLRDVSFGSVGGAAAAAVANTNASAGAAGVAAANGNLSLASQGKSNTSFTGAGASGHGANCQPCGENEMMMTTTVAGQGYSITESACIKCPPGTRSRPGSTSCEKGMSFELSALNPQPERDGSRAVVVPPARRGSGPARPVRERERTEEPVRPKGRVIEKVIPPPKNRKAEDPKAPHIKTPKKQGPVERATTSVKSQPAPTRSRAPSLDDIGGSVSSGSRAPGASGAPSPGVTRR